jgi:hypothetical protein
VRAIARLSRGSKKDEEQCAQKYRTRIVSGSNHARPSVGDLRLQHSGRSRSDTSVSIFCLERNDSSDPASSGIARMERRELGRYWSVACASRAVRIIKGFGSCRNGSPAWPSGQDVVRLRTEKEELVRAPPADSRAEYVELHPPAISRSKGFGTRYFARCARRHLLAFRGETPREAAASKPAGDLIG